MVSAGSGLTWKVVAVAVALLAATVALWGCWHRPGAFSKPITTVSILSQAALLDLLRTIRQRHSAASVSLRKAARSRRRRHIRDSEAYRQCILHYNDKGRSLLREVSKTVIREMDLTETMVIASCAFYEGDEEVDEAKARLGVVINDTRIPPELDLPKAQEIYLYCRERSIDALDDSSYDLVVRNVALEDEVWERFGFEMEEVERGFERYRRELKSLETRLKLQNRRSNSFAEDGFEAM